jgi:hypothetical protein
MVYLMGGVLVQRFRSAFVPQNFSTSCFLLCSGWFVDVHWNAAVFWKLLLPRFDRQYSNTTRHAIWRNAFNSRLDCDDILVLPLAVHLSHGKMYLLHPTS